MKKLAVFVVAIALTLGLAQCKKEQTPSSTGETVFITLNVDDDASTGSATDGTRVNVDTTANQITFVDGDQILVVYDGKYVGFLVRSTEGGVSQFSGDITITQNGEQPLYFYFLGNKQDDNSLIEGTITTCTVNISDQTNYPRLPVISMGRSVNPNNLNEIVPYVSGEESYTARLYNKCTLKKFNVTTTHTDAPICIIGLNNVVTVHFDKAGEQGTGLGEDASYYGFSFSMDPDDYGLIKLPAGAGDKWAIVLPQNETKTACCYTDELLTSSVCGPVPTFSANYNEPYDDANPVNLTIETPRLVPLASIGAAHEVQSGQVLTGTLPGNYQISVADNATVTLKGVSINGTNTNFFSAGLTCIGNTTIILEENTTNTVNGFVDWCPGIRPGPMGTTLTIKGSGTLVAKCPTTTARGAAGIGCGVYYVSDINYNLNCGIIRIEGGNITAQGGRYSAGIGTSDPRYDGNGNCLYPNECEGITITGGNITAYGGYTAAGIGTGAGGSENYHDAQCGPITITGGHIVVKGSYGYHDNNNIVAGIGAHDKAYCTSISIGGTSSGNATAGSAPAGFVAGAIGGMRAHNCGSVTIFGSSVSCTSHYWIDYFGFYYEWTPTNHNP